MYAVHNGKAPVYINELVNTVASTSFYHVLDCTLNFYILILILILSGPLYI